MEEAQSYPGLESHHWYPTGGGITTRGAQEGPTNTGVRQCPESRCVNECSTSLSDRERPITTGVCECPTTTYIRGCPTTSSFGTISTTSSVGTIPTTSSVGTIPTTTSVEEYTLHGGPLQRSLSCGSDSGYSASSGSNPGHLAAALSGSSASLGAELRVGFVNDDVVDDGIVKDGVTRSDVTKDGVIENGVIEDAAALNSKPVTIGAISDCVVSRDNSSVSDGGVIMTPCVTTDTRVGDDSVIACVPGCRVVDIISHGMVHDDQGTAPLILINGSSGADLDPCDKVTSRVTASPLEETPARRDSNDAGRDPSTDRTNSRSVARASVNSQSLPEAVVTLPDRFRPHRKRRPGAVEAAGCGCRNGDDRSAGSETRRNAVRCDRDCGGKTCCDCCCCCCRGDVVIDEVCSGCSASGSGRTCACSASQRSVVEKEEDRARDVGLAIQWLRHQMIQMKAQDKVLMRQFLELRASIRGLRAVNLTPSSTIDLSTTSSRAVSFLYPTNPGVPSASMPWLHTGGDLDRGRTQDTSVSPGLQGLRDECEVEFRARTVSMVPARPRSKLQTRVFSKEFV